MKKDCDLTKGKPLPLLLSFSVSLIIGNLFQQLYIIVDGIIIGKKAGVEALSAIGGTDWLIFMINGFVIGLIQGFSVMLGKKYGEKDEIGFRVYYKVAKTICMIFSVASAVFLMVISNFMLNMIGTKREVFSYAKTYVDIIFAGLPLLVFYQFFVAVLRSRGNSKTHLVAMTVSSISNILLDILFVSVLDMGVAGAALGTVASEFIVMLICGFEVWRIQQRIFFGVKSARGHQEMLPIVKELLVVGVPMALQSVITAIGGLIVISKVNSYELAFLSAYTIAGKIYVLLEIAASSYGLAIIAYVSQNAGANDYKRVRLGVRTSIYIGVATALVCALIIVIFGKTMIQFFLDSKNSNENVIAYGLDYLKILAAFFPLLYVLYIIRAAIQGMGNSIIPMSSSFAQLFMRVICAVGLTRIIGAYGIYWGEICAWTFADVFLIVAYYIIIKSKRKYVLKA